MKRLTTIMAFIANLGICTKAAAQLQADNPKYEFGINLGFLVYQGDLTPRRLGSFETQKFSVGLHASRLFSPSFSARGNVLIGKLKADESKYATPDYRQQRNFAFTTPVIELSGQLVWNVLGRNYINKGFSPYVFAGTGFAFLKIRPDWSNLSTTYFNPEVSDVWAGLAADSAHALPRLLPVVPIGAGIKYHFSPRLALNAETSFRLSYSDYIDGFSQSVNPNKNDHYLNYSVGLIYRAGKKDRLGCPVINY